MHTSRMVPLLFMIGGVFVEIAAEPARGQCQATEFAKLLASDGAPYDQFAGTVSVSGDVAVVGANLDDDAGANSGSAYVFCFDGSSWSQCAKLTASDAAPNDNFGSGVGISGDVAVIGAFGDDDESGAAYIFVKPEGGWANMTETYKLPAPDDAAPGDRFGHCLAISGSTIVIGAYLDDNDNGNNAGSAYVFRFDGTDWNQEAKLTASDGEPGDNFGSTGISTSRDVAVIGVFLDDNENGNG